MKKETVRAVRALARQTRMPPPKIKESKKIYNRKPKHRAGFSKEYQPFSFEKDTRPSILLSVAHFRAAS